jgi:uncharacterized protein YndB with AHSA1/START domain
MLWWEMRSGPDSHVPKESVMPIKKDGKGNRWVEMEFITPGTPEEVWHAMATGPGNAAWFTAATIEERVGGVFRLEFGLGATSSGEVTVWDPPRRFGYVERDWSEGAPPVATEITITGRSGNRCVVRMVHSLFSTADDWDDQMEGFEAGWPWFFEVLRIYLSHFAGMPAASFIAQAAVDGDQLPAWKRLKDDLGLAGADAGQPLTTATEPERLSGVVESMRQDAVQRTVLVRLDTPAPGVALIGTYGAGPKSTASICLFFYGDGAQAVAAASEQKWRGWLAETFTAAGR